MTLAERLARARDPEWWAWHDKMSGKWATMRGNLRIAEAQQWLDLVLSVIAEPSEAMIMAVTTALVSAQYMSSVDDEAEYIYRHTMVALRKEARDE